MVNLKYVFEDFSYENYMRVHDLFKLHQEESGPLPWRLDIDSLAMIMYGVKTARLEDELGNIVAYAVYRISRHPHYSKMVASQEVLFVHPDHRKGLTGYKFLKQIEKSLRDLLVDGLLFSCTVKKDLGRVYERLGFKEIERVFFKDFTGGE